MVDPTTSSVPASYYTAHDLIDLFSNKDYLGADAKHIRLLLGKEDAARHSQPATRENILKALKWAATSAQRNDLLIFAFFGRAAPCLRDLPCSLAPPSHEREKRCIP